MKARTKLQAKRLNNTQELYPAMLEDDDGDSNRFPNSFDDSNHELDDKQ